MTATQSRGRPLQLNQTLVNAICNAVELEFLTRQQVYDRFRIKKETFRGWFSLGERVLTGEIEGSSTREMLCKQLVERLNRIHLKHEKTFHEKVSQPEGLETMRLALYIDRNTAVNACHA